MIALMLAVDVLLLIYIMYTSIKNNGRYEYIGECFYYRDRECFKNFDNLRADINKNDNTVRKMVYVLSNIVPLEDFNRFIEEHKAYEEEKKNLRIIIADFVKNVEAI